MLDFLDLAPSRPDLILHDLISLISPGFLPSYTTSFLRSLSSRETIDQVRLDQICVAAGMESASLGLTSCAAPASGLSAAAGLLQNAYLSTAASSAALATAGLSRGATIGAAVGGAVGGSVLIALGVVGALCWRRRRAMRRRNGDDEDGMELPRMEKTISASSTESILPVAAGRSEGAAEGAEEARGKGKRTSVTV